MMLMKINKLIIEGPEYKRTLEFKAGLNIIQGDKYSGKSLVLNLIDHAFGDRDGVNPNSQKELREKCEFVMLDLSIGDMQLSFKRNLWRNKSFIEVYFCESDQIKNYAPKTLELDEFYRFVFELLEIPEFKLLKHLQHSKEYTVESLSFRDLFRYVYISQHELGTPNFMGLNLPAKKNKNKVMFEVLFGFIEYDVDNLVNKIKELENQRVDIENQIKGLTSYLNEQQFKNKEEVLFNYKQISNQILEIVEKKKALMNSISDGERNIEHIYVKINNHINELEDKYFNISSSKKNAELTIFQKESLISDYNNELVELMATKEANEILPKIEHQLKCPLCRQKVEFDKTQSIVNDINSVDQIIGQLKNKIFTAKKSIEFTKEQMENIEKKLASLLEEKGMYEKAKMEYQQKIRTPFIPEIEALNKLYNEFSEKQMAINEGLKIFNKLSEKSYKVNKLEEDIAELRKKIKENMLEEEEKQYKLSLLEKRYIGFLRSFRQKVNKDTYINSKSYLPMYDNAGLQDHDSGGMLVCMQLAYLFAILFTKKRNETFKHPGFMMFDTISKYFGTIKADYTDDTDKEQILDPEIYEKVYSDMYRIGNLFQIIAVENTPPLNLDKRVIRYTFHNGEHGLIDMSKNEKI